MDDEIERDWEIATYICTYYLSDKHSSKRLSQKIESMDHLHAAEKCAQEDHYFSSSRKPIRISVYKESEGEDTSILYEIVPVISWMAVKEIRKDGSEIDLFSDEN